MKRFLQLVLCLIGLPALAAGLNDGTSWEDAWTNWASVTWTRGDTYYLAGGTYTGFTNSTADTGSWITLKKANATDNENDAGWKVTYATDQALLTGASSSSAGLVRLTYGHWEIDGVTGSGMTGHGIKIYNTLNDGVNEPAPLLCFGNGQTPHRIHHVELAGTGHRTQVKGGDGIYQNNGSDQKGTHISECYIHGVDKNGVTFGNFTGTSYSDYGLLFENNVIQDTGGSTGVGWHGQGMQLAYAQNWKYNIIRGNTFSDIEGSGMIVFMDGGAMFNDVLVYNNVFYLTESTTHQVISPGVINNLGGGLCTNLLIANNTFYNIGGATNKAQIMFYPLASNPSVYLTNNVWESCTFTMTNYVNSQGNNGYYGNTGAGVPSGTPGQVNGASTTFTSPGTYDFTLKPGGYAIGAGADLSSIFTTDFAGTTRYAPWDIGAYQSADLIGWWKFEEGTGTSAADSSGYGNTGSFTNGTTWGPGRVGTYSVSLDGVDDMVRVPFSANWDFAGDFTISAWVFCKTNSRVVAVGRWTDSLGNGWSLEQITSTRFDMEYQDRTILGENAHRSIGSGLGYTTNTWHFVTGVKSNDVVRIYVDGNVGTTSDPITNSIVLTGKGVNVGSRREVAPDEAQWMGYVDDVRIYKRMLSVAEILALYNGPGDVTAPTPDPMTWSSVPAAVDSVSITMVASTATDETSTVSYYFDETSGNPGGSDSGWQASATYVDTGLNPSTTYTYWVKARDDALNETGYSSSENATTDAELSGTTTLRSTIVRAGTIRRP
jgi:hypothetical protein